MKHKVLLPIQKKWIEWLLGDGWDWMNIRGNTKDNHIHLNWTWVNGVYDVRTEQLLNHLLKEFNNDEEIKRQWYLKLEWDKANVI
jgi:hypothetical protein